MTSMYKPGQKVHGTVYRILPHLLLVRLTDGTTGIVREREFSWSKEPLPADEVATIGQEIDAIVLSAEPESGQLSLSLRLAERDPWIDAPQRYPEGSIVDGDVVGVSDRAAFVELEAGVEGRIHISQIDAESRPARVSERLLVGDRVRAVVLGSDQIRRRFDLSMIAYQQRLSMEQTVKTGAMSGASIEDLLGPQMAALLKRAMEDLSQEEEPELSFPRLEHALKVVIVDDDDGFRTSLAGWLRDRGCIVAEATTMADGKMTVASVEPDIVFLDMNMPDGKATETAQAFQAAAPTSNVVVVSGFEPTEEEIRQIEAMGLRLDFKPLDLRELVEMLQTVARLGRLPPPVPTAEREQEGKELFATVSASVQQREDLRTSLGRILARLCTATGAAGGAVFSHDAVGGDVVTLATHDLKLADGVGQRTLQYSPVRNVILEDKGFFEDDAEKARPRFRYLLDIIQFRSCIGVPVPTLADTLGYALFLFHPEPGKFRQDQVTLVTGVASLAGTAIARQEGEQRLRAAQQLILAGQLSSATFHEVNNKLGGAVIEMARLLDGLAHGEKGAGAKALTTEDIRARLVGMNRTMESILDSIHLFRRIVRAETIEPVQVNDAVRRAADLVRPLVERNKVRVELNLAPDVPKIQIIGVRLDQALYNVYLNATQWSAFRPDACVRVSTTFLSRDSERQIQIRIRDTGPGIHRLHFERIYELGYSTKTGGSGIGLFVSRGLVESLGGRISVESSIIGVGSTFLINLPAEGASTGG